MKRKQKKKRMKDKRYPAQQSVTVTTRCPDGPWRLQHEPQEGPLYAHADPVPNNAGFSAAIPVINNCN